jgi:hypothetical protein
MPLHFRVKKSKAAKKCRKKKRRSEQMLRPSQ